ncbi:MAG: FAD-dependent oxidoreductase, partial [Promethearchaeota archaeon]
MNIGIIGAGFTGLELAYYLTKLGNKVAIYEQSNQLGGLATYHNYDQFYWDRFYHVILPSDNHLVNFIKEIGLGDKLRWKNTLTGIWVDKKLYSISNTVEFIKFPPLGIFSKMRLAFTLLYGSMLKEWKRLEKISVEEWLIRISGKKTYEKIWEPLLLAKLGENYKRVSAVFIWTYIKRLFSARNSSAKKEQLGHVEGGYKTVLDHLENKLVNSGVEFFLNTVVESVDSDNSDKISIKTQDAQQIFDKVIFTGPVNVLEKIVSKNLVNIDRNSGVVEYLGVICVVLV